MRINNKLENVIRNDSLTITATVTDPATGSAVSLDGYTAYLTVKEAVNTTSNANDDPGLMQIQISPVNDPSGTGIITFNCAPSDTNILPGSHWYDIQVIAPNGNIYSSVASRFIVIGDTTRAVN